MCYSTDEQCQYRSVCCDGDCPCRLMYESFSKEVYNQLQADID